VKPRRLLQRAIARPASLRFDEAVKLAEALGFERSRTSGSHHIFTHPAIPELVNLQDVGNMAKPYQVRQLLKLVERYNLTLGDEA
jgi:predicted RNA binding protein YcfA (HicA-like mRNA interferase family)